MPLPKRLCHVFRQLVNCDMLTRNMFDEKSIVEFERLLNLAQPVDEFERTSEEMVKTIYHRSVSNFRRYLSLPRNNVAPLVLWTEAKFIAWYFRLRSKVVIKWDKTTKFYSVTKFRRKRMVDVKKDTEKDTKNNLNNNLNNNVKKDTEKDTEKDKSSIFDMDFSDTENLSWGDMM